MDVIRSKLYSGLKLIEWFKQFARKFHDVIYIYILKFNN